MISAFGIEHGFIEKKMNPTKFARLYPVGEHHVPVRHLNRLLDNQHRSYGNVRHVADSMAKEGQRHAVAVSIIDGKAHVMNGHHRIAAAKAIGRKRIKIKVSEGPYRSWNDPGRGHDWHRPVPWPKPSTKMTSTKLDEV